MKKKRTDSSSEVTRELLWLAEKKRQPRTKNTKIINGEATCVRIAVAAKLVSQLDH